ncbi:protein UL112 [Cercopithecine betaherpesvirus 5]|uniref:Protein UL112 n=1 Tax=Simian cytomegalovirus (strain Colburn) TaxID=50292 RepID=G8XU02_SCMVC|nr:protein UL112 [Cercopithecine betaherpesvirus 5]
MESGILQRKYWTFYGVNRGLHQNVNSDFDVRQFNFDSARLVKCTDGEGTTTTYGKGWLCCTVVQHGDPGSDKGQQRRGCLSLDVTVENTLDSMSGSGMVLNNKNVASVVGTSGNSDSSLLTVIVEGNTIQVTHVKHCAKANDSGAQASSSGASSSSSSVSGSVNSDERRARSEHRREHKKQQQQQQQANSVVEGSNGQMRVSGGTEGIRDPRMLNRPKERRQETDDKRLKTHHEHSKNEVEHPPHLIPADGDPVAFLNYAHAPLTEPGADGALHNETPRFGGGDVVAELAEARPAAPAPGNSGAEVGTDDGVRASTSTEQLTPATSEVSSNCRVPPNPQATTTEPIPPHPRSPPFDDIIQSLTRLINECSKDDRLPNVPPLSTRHVSECESRAATPAASASTSAAPVCDIPRPVCEIRPYVVTPTAAPQPQPEQAGNSRRTRGGARPRSGPRGGGGGRRTPSASTSRRRRRNRDDEESEDEVLPGPSRRRAVPPSFAEDGLEIIDSGEEAALAAASIAAFFD